MDETVPSSRISIPVHRHGDNRGELAVLTDEIPKNFDIKRIYYVKPVKKGQKRGSHAHRSQSQIIFVLSGRITLTVFDGISSYSVDIPENSDGILMQPLTWCTIESEDENSLYLVMANGQYDPSEYITDFEEFKKLRL